MDSSRLELRPKCYRDAGALPPSFDRVHGRGRRRSPDDNEEDEDDMRNSNNDPAPSRGTKTRATLYQLAAGCILAVLTGSAAMSCGAQADDEALGEESLAATSPVTASFQNGVSPTT